MSTKELTLVPDAWSDDGGSYWHSYDGTTDLIGYQAYVRFPVSTAAYSVFQSNLYIRAYYTGDPSTAATVDYYAADISTGNKELIKSAAYYGGIEYDNEEYYYRWSQSIVGGYLYIYFDTQNRVNKRIKSVKGKVSYYDLTIKDISPANANSGDEVTVTFEGRHNSPLALTLKANNRTIATYSVPASREIIVEEEGGEEGEPDTFTFTCGEDWFTRAGATGNELNITVEATEDSILNRRAQGSFKLRRESIGTEIVEQPTVSGADSTLALRFTRRNGHNLTLKIEGAAKGSQNRVTLVQNTTVSSDTYSVTAANSWFNNINGNTMTVYITVTDDVDGRADALNFDLDANPALKPTVNVTLSNISGSPYLDNKGYVKDYSRIEIQATGTTYAGTSVSSVVAKSSTEQDEIVLNYDSSKQAYVGVTSNVISSTSVTVKVTVTDTKARSTDKTVYIQSKDITVLPSMTMRQTGAIIAGDNDTPGSNRYPIYPTGYVGYYRLKITANNDGHTILNWAQYSIDTEVLVTYSNYFVATGNAGESSVNIRFYAEDALGRKVSSSGYVAYTIFAPNPLIRSFSVVHVPDSRMPDDEAGVPKPTKADVVSGYSKLTLNARVRWYYSPSSVEVKESSNTYTLSKTSNYSSNSWPREADYSGSTGVIDPTSSKVTYTPSATDSGEITSPYNRTRKTTSTVLAKEITIYRLQNIILKLTSSQLVSAESQATFSVSNYVGTYHYKITIGTETITGDTEISTGTFGFTIDTEWFSDATGGEINIGVNIYDVLGRSQQQDITFRARLTQFTLTFSRDTITIDDPSGIQISVGGSGTQTIDLVLTTPKDGEPLELASTTATASSPATVICPKTWFTANGFDTVWRLPVTVSAAYGGRTTTKVFYVVYPNLGLALKKSDGSGGYVTATEAFVDEEIRYEFSNQEGEAVYINYLYGVNNSSILDLGPYSNAYANIETPLLFNYATNANTLKTMTNVTVRVSDRRGRIFDVTGFAVKVSESMAPTVSNLTITPVNDGVDSTFDGLFLNNFSKFLATVTVARHSNATIQNVVLTFQSQRYSMQSIGNNQYQYESDKAIVVSQLDLNQFTVEASDQRGMKSNFYMTTINVENYTLPKATIAYHRCNQDKSPNDGGEYCLVTCNYDFAGVQLRNAVPITYKNVGHVTVAESSTQYSDTVDLPFRKAPPLPPGVEPPYDDILPTGTLEFMIPNMSIERTYDITIMLTDLITSTTYKVKLSTGGVIMDFLAGGKGIGLGMVSQHYSIPTVEINPEWHLKTKVLINGNLVDLESFLEQVKSALGL